VAGLYILFQANPLFVVVGKVALSKQCVTCALSLIPGGAQP
jgi:hypothetical protein